MIKKPGSQSRLKKSVLEQSLCTGCGACVGLCPYQVIYADRTVQLFDCDLPDGKCYAFCPRTPADHNHIRKSLFDVNDLTPEIGAVKGYYFSRALNPRLRADVQHGGTVTALLELAMGEGVIDSAIVSSRSEDFEQCGLLVTDQIQLRRHSKSWFTVSPTLAAFNRIPDDRKKRTGVVATPCQAMALAKMKTAEIPGNSGSDFPGLVIGLFCGWTLSMEKFHNLLARYGITEADLTGMDIPAGKNILELFTAGGLLSVPMAEVDHCVRTACRYCMDSTAEFADLSVGAARFGTDCEEMRGWNQIIVRSDRGKELIELAVAKQVLQLREASAQALRELKRAAAEKKKKALKNIVEKSRSAKNLLYLKSDDPIVRRYLSVDKKRKGKS
ncbi:MAG TPA: Coenzyme F420 hydrogenase/dehydrogenase, beta subunit C-terminal domain [Smithellaceae bacterium]|jgi:coenzyme F420 hydrogenase subunit beta|nr:Coenzyme F420 hydrogenase/dehydrogenase, beta subunit C-terminal domain [Smithellaceae bacterium]HOQ41810.1 Coenzyme F420 hydrogenase/dehydrogenase, beta subunit C-terminal domain [Smithellaceae bacterium]HPL66481.1 Coenzyme F420 hydrogenase/dehydrogenase, beta subunit C-terminal domain [Smithellaceae bacterium]HQP24358.1 Coenzyme F420 hydrogenase/dehydrogenase, beta subunit C-terminal domain [Smithellaceae bacterium]HRY35894.1 Coenzyme F420 hydrogenase/dehydrogenase, beta subunit C-terminal